MTSRLAPPVLFTAALVVAAFADAALPAQSRQPEVRVPGIDFLLKAGWRLLIHRGCRYSVPESWGTNGDASLALAPDGSSLSFRVFRITNWSSHRAQIKAALGHVSAVHEDSEQRLWFEIAATPRVQYYVDVANGLNVCSGLLEFWPATSPDEEDTMKRIAESIGPAPEKWPGARIDVGPATFALAGDSQISRRGRIPSAADSPALSSPRDRSARPD